MWKQITFIHIILYEPQNTDKKDVANFLKAKVNTSRSPQHNFSLFCQSGPHVLCVQCKDMYSWALQVWCQPTDSVSCLPLPMLSGIKAEMSQNSPSLLPHKITSVYQLHVNPSGPSFLFFEAVIHVWKTPCCVRKEKCNAEGVKQESHPYDLFIVLTSLLFSENILESSPRQSVLRPSPSAGLVVGWSPGREQGGASLGSGPACEAP